MENGDGRWREGEVTEVGVEIKECGVLARVTWYGVQLKHIWII